MNNINRSKVLMATLKLDNIIFSIGACDSESQKLLDKLTEVSNQLKESLEN